MQKERNERLTNELTAHRMRGDPRGFIAATLHVWCSARDDNSAIPASRHLVHFTLHMTTIEVVSADFPKGPRIAMLAGA